MIKKFKIFEGISWWKDGQLSDEENVEEEEYEILTRYNARHGKKVICIKDTVQTNSSPILITKGQIKVINGTGNDTVWFSDTPSGAGGYPMKDFAIID